MDNPPADNARAERVGDVVAAALERAPAERAAFLLEACGDDERLRAEVQSLLSHEAGAEFLLAAPAFASAGGRLFGPDPGELRPGDTLGDCRIVRFLGEGGTGEVYLAQDTRLERPVAVKLLKRQFDEERLLRRFHHERRVLAGLTHPNIARLYGGATTPEGRSYLVMEYVEGERLDRFCDTQGLDVTGRLALFRKVCAAVAYAHQNLVVHRDLKPANVRVTAEGEPKLLDFGIAKLLETAATAPEGNPTLTLQAMMTPEYASPEQLRGEAITTASDVYSLGVVLYELLTGQRPYAVASRRPDELARAICEQEPARPSTVAGRGAGTKTGTVPGGETPARRRRRLEGDLDNIVAMALRKEPARRYGSVGQFSEDLRRHGEGLPVSARRDTLGYRAGKFARRNRTAVVAAALVALALLGGLVAATWQAHVADQERDRARLAQIKAEAARQQAETAQKQTQRINEFLQTLLGSANPTKLGKDVKVSQVLDAASAGVDRELANEPEVLAQVHQTLGQTYVDIGQNGVAATHFQTALTIFRRLRGDEDPRTVGVAHQLAISLNRTGAFTQSEPLLRHEIAWLLRHPPEDNPKLASALSALGFCLAQTQRFPESEAVLRDALARNARAAGENSGAYAAVLNQLGVLKRAQAGLETGVGFQRDADAAADFLQRSLAILDRIAPDRPNEVVIRLNLCFVYLDQQKFAEAEAQLARVDKDRVRIFGEGDNLYSAEALMVRDSIHFGRGDFAAVAAEGEPVVEREKVIAPSDETVLAQGRFLLGASLTRTGHAAEGEPFLRAALASRNAADRVYLSVYGNVETALGDCLFAQKRYAEAEPWLLAGYDAAKRSPDEPDRVTVESAARLHEFYTAWNKPAAAARFAGGGARADGNRPR